MKIILAVLLALTTVVRSQVRYGSHMGRHLTIDDTRIYYEEYGKGTPVLLLHGGWGSIADFGNCIPGLAEKYRLIIPDQPGNGRSEFPNKPLSYQLMADLFSKMLVQLQVDSAYAIGWSDGGIIALMMAMDPATKLRKVMAAGPNYLADALRKDIQEERNMQTLEWIEKNDTAFVKWYKGVSPSGDWRRLVRETYRMWEEPQYFPRTDFRKIKAQVLLIFGDKDDYSLSHALDMHAAIPGCRLCVLPDTYHAVFHQRPEMVNQLAFDFFGQ